MRTLLHKNSATGIRLKKFGLALQASPPISLRSRQLIFICGANQAAGIPSARRATLKSFIQKSSASSTVIYAEGIFNELRKYGSQKNILDLEHRITEIADKVVIILESASAYCELGAFAHETLRHKLVVINDARYKNSDSFINLGPLAALQESKSPVIWYPMSSTGINTVDGIGATFPDIKRAIAHTANSTVPVDLDSLSNLKMNKTCLYFVHDIVLFAGPISHEEIILILKEIFGDKSFDSLKSLLGVLRESQLINARQIENRTWVYKAVSTEFFLQYRVDVYALMAAFRQQHLRIHPERFRNE